MSASQNYSFCNAPVNVAAVCAGAMPHQSDRFAMTQFSFVWLFSVCDEMNNRFSASLPQDLSIPFRESVPSRFILKSIDISEQMRYNNVGEELKPALLVTGLIIILKPD